MNVKIGIAGPAYVFTLNQSVPEGGIVCSVCDSVKRAVVADNEVYTCIKCWITLKDDLENSERTHA